MFGHSWKVARIAGVDIRVDSSWVVIVLLIGYSLYFRFDELYGRRASTGSLLGMAILATVLFFVSLLTHEMAHALVSKARGIRVQDITLFLFGGATRARVESRGPGDEFVISAVGPLTSVALAGVFWGLQSTVAGRTEPLDGVFGYLAWVNLLLAAFNVLPGFPLDGGRLLRSAVWKATGSIRRATRVAGAIGQGFGYVLIVGGLFFLLYGGAFGGLWLAVIGWFLARAARDSYEDLVMRQVLERTEAEDVMIADLRRVPPDLTIREAVDGYFMRHDHGAFPVETEGRTVGLLTLRGIRRVPREEWETRRVSDVMVGLDQQVKVSADTPMDRVVGRLEDAETHRVLVVRDGEVVGIITPSDVARWLQRWRAIEGEPAA